MDGQEKNKNSFWISLADFFVRTGKILGGWFGRVFAPLKKPLKRAGAWFKKKFGKYISVSFFVMLFISFSLWFMIKLGYEYTTELPFMVNVEGREFRVNVVASGKGSVLFSHKFYRHKVINLRLSDLEVTQSAVNPGWVTIMPYSMQNAISTKTTDLRILSVGTIPELEL